MDDPPQPPMRRCTACPNSYPATSEFFYVHSGRLYSQCKECVKASRRADRERRTEYMRQYRQTEKWKTYNKKYHVQYYQEHKDEILAQNKQYNETHREERIARQRQYRKDHPDLLREQEKQRRERHREKIRERKRRWQQGETHKTYQKRYRKEHRDEIRAVTRQNYIVHREERTTRQRQYGKTAQGRMVYRAHWHRRRAQKVAAGGSYTAQQIQEQLKRQRYQCYYAACGFAKFEKKNGQYVYHIEHTIPLSRTEAGPRNEISHIVLACPSCNLQKGAKLPHEWPEGGKLL